MSVGEREPTRAGAVLHAMRREEPRRDDTVLVGDIGGTNARFGVMAQREDRLELVDEVTYPSCAFSSLPEALAALGTDSEAARHAGRACFGIAGPIRGNRCEATNLPWVIDGGDLAEILGIPEVPLLNDLEAAAWGLSRIDPGDVWTVQPGDSNGDADATGNRALLSAGTGLGEAALLWNGRVHVPFATEGGHADFAPASELQVELWRHLAARLGHVSWERVVSGPGLVAIYRFLLERAREAEPDWLEDEARHGDAAAAVSRRAREEGCRHCRAAVDLFAALLGAEAGNLALHTLATGGVYLAGGTARNLRDELRGPGFLEAFRAKGRFRPLLERVPVHVVMDDRLGLRGAAARVMAR